VRDGRLTSTKSYDPVGHGGPGNKTRAGTGFGELASPAWNRSAARRSRSAGSPRRCCSISCSSRPSKGFSEMREFRGCGHAVSAGRAPFATEVSDAAVPIRAPACVLPMPLPTRYRVRATRGVSGAHLRPRLHKELDLLARKGIKRAGSLTPIAAARL
jgi:hypothetical protein